MCYYGFVIIVIVIGEYMIRSVICSLCTAQPQDHSVLCECPMAHRVLSIRDSVSITFLEEEDD